MGGRARLAVMGVVALALAACTPPSPAEKLASLAEQTKVCVDNPTFHSMRVEIQDARTRHEYGELDVRSGREACKWMRLPKSSSFSALIKSVSVRHDVVPPAWRDMILGQGPMELVVGSDGLTPFAHSSRRR